MLYTNKKYQSKILKVLYIIFFLAVIVSCKTNTKVIEVPIETIKTEYVELVKYDSIYSKDSIVQKELNDTIYLEMYKYLYKYKYLRDTINIVDSIPIVTIQEVTKEVNKLYNWQYILMVLGGGLIVVIVYKLIRIIKT